MSMTALFYHGWGFDHSIWNKVVGQLEGWRALFVDRGYFGQARRPVPDGPNLVVAHSFGTMLALHDPPQGCVGIVAINGFDRFVADSASPGVHPRILRRMADRFEGDPLSVLREFRGRCGCETSPPHPDKDALGEDLHLLATMDCRDDTAATPLPILSLQGDADPILPEAMRDTIFGRAHRIERRTVAGGGHLLPLTDPAACCKAIREIGEVPA
ncbi:MAG: alpha/beta fold hydrolase [Novosphingobium sp.]|nr:alpha/beta fold hydrolase [Novosphingobium sp.]